MFRALLVLAIVALGSVISKNEALASGKTIAVYVEGSDGRRMRETVLKAIPRGIDVVDDKVFVAALAHVQHEPLGKDLDPKAVGRIQTAAHDTGVDAVLVVRTRPSAKARVVLLIVVDLMDGPGPVKKARLALNSHQEDGEEIAAALGDALDRYASRPPEPPTAPALEARAPVGTERTLPPVAMPEPYRSGAAITVGVRPTTAERVAKSFLEVTLGADIYGRRFEYRNGISRSPSIDSRLQAVATGASGKIFPFSGEGPLGGIGIAADYSSALFRTTPNSYSFAICARIPMRSDARALIGASVGYAVASFPSVGTPNAELPGVTYRSIRPALDARVTLGHVSVLASTAFRAILDADAISTRFYNPRGYGFDAEVGAALMFAPRFEWRLVARYTRYLFAFTPPEGATFAAGDALDQWYGAQGSLAFVF